MATIQSLVVNLTTNAQPFQQGLKSAQNSLTSFVSQAQSSGSGLAGMFAGGLGIGAGLAIVTSAVTAATSAIKGLFSTIASGIGTGIKLAADFEQAETALTTSLKSADKAKAVLSDLSAFAAATPFKTDELVSSARLFAGLGVEADQIIPTLKVLGDVAAGSGQKVGDLGLIYAQVMNKGRLQTEELLQFAERNVPLNKVLQQNLKVTGAELSKMLEQGKVSFADLQRAFVTLTSEGGAFFGQTKNQSQTLAGLWSTLTDNLDIALRDIGQAIIKNLDLKAAVSGITSAITTIGTYGVKIVTDLTSKMRDMGITGQNVGVWVQKAFEIMVTGGAYVVQYGIKPMIANFYALRIAINTVVGSALNQFSYLAQALEAITAGISKVTGGQVGVVKGLSTSLQGLSQGFAANVKEDVQNIKDLFAKDAVADASKWLEKMRVDAAYVAPVVEKAVAPLKVSLAGDWGLSKLKELGKTASTIGKDIQKSFGDKYTQTFEEARRVIESTRTPTEKFESEAAKLRGLLSQGLINDETFGRAIKQAAGEARKSLGVTGDPQKSGAIERRSGFRTVAQPKVKDPVQDLIAKSSQKTASGVEKLVGALASKAGNVIVGLFD